MRFSYVLCGGGGGGRWSRPCAMGAWLGAPSLPSQTIQAELDVISRVAADGTWSLNLLPEGDRDKIYNDFFKMSKRLYLCKQKGDFGGIEVKDYFITDETWAARLTPEGVAFHQAPKSYQYDRLKPFAFDEDFKNRLQRVTGVRFYSLLLSNSEHWARYLADGAWVSYVAVMPEVLKKLETEVNDPAKWKAFAKFLNALPAELSQTKMLKKPLYQQRPSWLTYTTYLDLLQERDVDEGYNVVVLGPSGAGKSHLVNLLFNLEVAVSQGGARSVSKQLRIYQGKDRHDHTVNILDTIGFCERFMPSDELQNIMHHYIKANMMFIDKVVLVCSGRSEAHHLKYMKRFLKLLDRETDSHCFNVVLVYTKTDTDDAMTKEQSLVNIWSELGLGSSDRDYALLGKTLPSTELCGAGVQEADTVSRACCAGFRPDRPYEDIENDLMHVIDATFVPPRARIRPDTRTGCQLQRFLSTSP